MNEAASNPQSDPKGVWKVIAASSAGTMIEWYDFYLFGILATTMASLFYPKGNETMALIVTLATFATGFIVRPFGALFFGRIGDMVGRKYAFLVTLLIMGGSTFAIGLLPTFAQIGYFAPALLLLLRLLQGLAMGGEYGGAATYVAEHAPDGKRGLYTSFIQTTATLGLFTALGVILAVSQSMEPEDFNAWGWRIPFLLSIVLVMFSYVIRTKMAESPLFSRLKEAKKVSTNPLRESFADPKNLRLVLLALFGATAGQGVVWYTGQFYALYYLQTILNVAKDSAYFIIAIALLLGTPLFIVFGALSDRIGRKKIIVAGCTLAVLCYVPIYMGMVRVADIERFTPVGGAPVVKVEEKKAPDSGDQLRETKETTIYEEGTVTVTTTENLTNPDKNADLKPKTAIVTSGGIMFVLSLFVLVQVIFVTMVYGPIAAFLVELFPTRIRYTSMSLPYHIGNGVFGGLVPMIGVAVVAKTGNIYMGLAYPMIVAAVTAVVGGFFLPERRNVPLWDEE